LGDWPDIQPLAKDFDLMVDLVINHCSREHVWFTDYITNAAPGKDYFHEQEPNPELHQVLRPRNSPLLTEVHTREGVKRVWTTFSEDQVDVNFANPDVLMEFARILFFYARNGARYIRLDAIAYLWKRLGTTCMSLPETHMVVRILRGLIDVQGIPLTLITETNVPHEENVSYFGEGNEAHWVYQFSLAPLLLYSYLLGDARALVSWTQGLTPAPNGCSYFNFIASHDGIGLRPLEGLLDDADIEQLIDVVHQRGGFASMRSTPTGEERVYELNIALFSAFGGSVDDVDAYVAAHQLLIAYQGVPGLYLNALLGSLNDVKQMEITGRTRSINRGSWRADEVSERLADPESLHAVIFSRLSQSLKSRAQQRAFAPTAQQKFVQGGKDHLMFLRFDETQRILIVASFSAQPQQIDWPAASTALPVMANDLLTGTNHSTAQPMALAPHQVLWLDLG
jgi:sucrose phosphorylase